MTARGKEWKVREAVEQFLTEAPEHECEEEERCENHPGSFFVLATENGESLHVQSSTHQIAPMGVIQGLIQFLDGMFLDCKPEGMPDMVAWTAGREAIKQACEKMAPPGDVSFDVSSFLDRLQSIAEDDDE